MFCLSQTISSELENLTETLVQKSKPFLGEEYDKNFQKVDLRDIGFAIRNFFNNIQYLGPLREEPRAFYGRAGAHNPLYVGQKGENVAFVLKYYSKRKIHAILPPSNNEEFNPFHSESEEVTLGVAVQKWLEYLGIAKGVRVESMGKVGLTIQANIHGDSNSDLTNVGIGVSQVLPLVVLGLATTTEDATILLEQPELHLHPYVQSRLAETHSEHLINRIRYHIAIGSINYGKDAVIYFCEREDGSAQSEVNKVQIDKYGTIDHYPKGFFDETEKQLEAILMAAFERGVD